jgi:uncharacterized protein (DUF736 family)
MERCDAAIVVGGRALKRRFEDESAPYEIGAAWKKTSKTGKPFLSVKLEGPTLVQPINCALTRREPCRSLFNAH